MGDGCGEIGIAGEEPPERGDADELVSHRPVPTWRRSRFPLRHDQFVQGEEPLVVGGEPLDEELQLETEDPGVVEERLGHGKAVRHRRGDRRRNSRGRRSSARTCRFQSFSPRAIPFRWA